MFLRDLGLDACLALEEPVQGVIQFRFGDGIQVELNSQAGSGRLVFKCSSGRQLGSGLDDPRATIMAITKLRSRQQGR